MRHQLADCRPVLAAAHLYFRCTSRSLQANNQVTAWSLPANSNRASNSTAYPLLPNNSLLSLAKVSVRLMSLYWVL